MVLSPIWRRCIQNSRATLLGPRCSPRNGPLQLGGLRCCIGSIRIRLGEPQASGQDDWIHIYQAETGEEPMKKWPKSGWVHAGIALASAAILSAVVGYLTERSVLDYNIRVTPQYGETGWNSLGAFLGGLVAAIWTFPLAFILIFVIQRLFASDSDTDTPTDAPPTDNQ